eukprot:Opistho-2@21051
MSVQRKTSLKSMLISGQAHARIDPGVGHVDQRIAGDIEHGAQEDHGAHDGEVLARDRLDDEGAQARDAEEALEHQAAQEDVRQVAAGAGDDGDQCIAQHMAEQH